MSDIIDQLRKPGACALWGAPQLLCDAADEIERLRVALQEIVNIQDRPFEKGEGMLAIIIARAALADQGNGPRST